MNRGVSAAPRPHITPNTTEYKRPVHFDARDQGRATSSASNAHAASNIRGSRWVAADLTAGVSMKTSAATTPASLLAGTAKRVMCSPLILSLTKKTAST